MLSPWGWSWIAASLGGFLVGLLTLNLLLLVVPTAAFVFVAAELIAFGRATRGFGVDWFRWQRFENSSQVPVDGVGSMAVDLERSAASRGFYAEVFDPSPDTFPIVGGSPKLRTWWPTAEPLRLAYLYRPRERGEFRIGPTMVVAHHPLGFASRTAELANRFAVLVTPSLTVEEARAALASPQPGPGDYLRHRSGPGTEFRSLRESHPTDDVRRIVWRRSAIDLAYVAEREEEVRADLLVIIDCGHDARLGLPGSEGLELSIDGATVLMGAALARLDRVGLMVFSDTVEGYVPIQGAPDSAAALTEALARVRLSRKPFRLEAALVTAAEQLSSPTTIVLFSNLVTVPPGIGASVAAVRDPGHRLLILTPDFADLYPPHRDPLAEAALTFLREPTQREIDVSLVRAQRAGAPVAVYPPSRVRAAVVEAYDEIRAGGLLP